MMLDAQTMLAQPDTFASNSWDEHSSYPAKRMRVLSPFPNIKLRHVNRSNAANNNPKMRLVVVETQKISVSCEANTRVPVKEKFLPGFRHYDAPVGLPESPTLSASPASRASSPIESLPLDTETSTTLADHWSEEVYAKMLGLTTSVPPSKSIAKEIIMAQKLNHKPERVCQTRPELPVHNATYALLKPATPPPSTSGLSHTPKDILRLQLRSAFSSFFRDFSNLSTLSPSLHKPKYLVYNFSLHSQMTIPWTAKVESTLKSLWKLVVQYDEINGRFMPADGKARVSYRSVASGLVCSGLRSEGLCRVWDESLAYVKPERRDEEFVKGWLGFGEFVAVVWGVGMECAKC